MDTRMEHTRRSFLRNSGAAAIVYKVVDTGFQMKAAGPNDQVGLGFIGVGIRGSGLLDGFQKIPGVRPVIAADLYDGHLGPGKGAKGGKIETTKEYPGVVTRKGKRAVVDGAPDHW